MNQLKTHQTIGGFDFEGPYSSPEQLPENEGLYAVVCTDGRMYYFMDVGYAKNIKQKLDGNPKEKCWDKHKIGSIEFAYYRDENFTRDTYMTALLDLKKIFNESPCVHI